jgi:hypothetical protein
MAAECRAEEAVVAMTLASVTEPSGNEEYIPLVLCSR